MLCTASEELVMIYDGITTVHCMMTTAHILEAGEQIVQKDVDKLYIVVVCI